MRSCFVFSLMVFMTSLIAPKVFAQPPQAIADLIAKTYVPAVTSTDKVESGFFDICEKKSVEITAQDPVTLQPGKIVIKEYRIKGSTASDLKTVILMPPTGGENVLDRWYANGLCVTGIRVALVEHWDDDTIAELDMEMHDRGALRALAAVRHVIEYLKPTRPKQLGILGTSVGAITSTMILGADARVSAGVLIVGGVGMSEIISASSEEGLAKLRQERMTKLGFASQDDYKKALEQHVHIEPADFIGDTGPKKVLMFLALKDITVPTKNQFDLYHAFGRQDLSTYDGNHLETILHTSNSNWLNIVRFFKTNLE